MDLDIFSTRLEYRWVKLYDITDAVRFSFIVQNSLSYLNLNLGEYSDLNDRSRTTAEIANDFVNTEEKCRKIFTPTRSILYSMHLDLLAGREFSLKNDRKACIFNDDFRIPHIAKITLQCGFYINLISDFIEDPLTTTDQKLKILRLLLKFPGLEIHLFSPLEPQVVNQFIDFFYPKISDHSLFKSFIENFDLPKWMTAYEKPEILEFLFYHVHQVGRDLETEGYSLHETIDTCILRGFFLNIKPSLKYTDAQRFTCIAYDWYKFKISALRPNLTDDVFTNAEMSLKPERIYLILQILWFYISSSELQCTGAASEALRLLWNSNPYPYISFEEVEKAFTGILAEKEFRDMYKFYCKSICEIPSSVTPRSLKHFSRITIRQILWKCNSWLPEGINQTRLPKSLQSFLRLEEVGPPKFNFNTIW